jgi:glycogen debranching enzyme
LAAARLTEERSHVLKHGDTFAVFDHYGDIPPDGLRAAGLYHAGTRYLSCLLLALAGGRPVFLGAHIRAAHDQLTVTLTNPDLRRDGRARLPLGTLHLAVQTFLWQGTCYQHLQVTHYGLEPVETSLSWHFQADYADIFEVGGCQRPVRGQALPPVVTADRVVLGYRGLDGVVRRTVLQCTPPPSHLTASTARFDLSLGPQQEATVAMTIACQPGPAVPRVLPFGQARAAAQAAVKLSSPWSCHLHTSNSQINAWVHRARSDLHMLTTSLPTGPYPYAGVPWFTTPFGRDGLITALECLWLRPDLAKGVLAYLASTQATEVIPAQDAEPGKILHESRRGEMAALQEIPFGRYYGSVDATPLFVLLAGAYYARTGDLACLVSLWPHIEAALSWIERYGDRDGDGFVEYQRQAAQGLGHQGWKDSDTAIFHAHGALARGPIALCEVQGYVYAAQRAGAALATALGRVDRAAVLRQQAAVLRQRFEQAFWCEELSTYALALDGDKRPCRVRASNAGQCLFTGIASPEHARRVAQTLLAPASFSGWGVRTLAASESRYNPLGYHTGAVWPHDNALLAQGLARYGLVEQALHIWTGLFEAGRSFDLHRMPELFCGFPKAPGEGPLRYPGACAPQAWAAGAVLLLFQACLGLELNAPEGQVSFTRPHLPASLEELWIHNLEVAGATVDLRVVRHQHGVGVHVVRGEGNVEILVG